MDTTSSKPLLDALRAHRLLEFEQLKQLDGATFADPKALARDLIQRGWLTPYQANQLLNGKGHELVLGSYILLERLGEGGMGQVFKARHRALGRVCALKLIRKERMGNADIVKRFQREVRSAAALAHPNIVLAYDADEIAGTYLMVMEYIDGATDLAKLVKTNGPLPIARACEYVRQAALGLQHAHERGMVHRDIKPANLLLTRDGQLVKVLDMGLARLDQADDDGESTSTMTHEGAVMGTPDYIAPEQARDTHTVDIRADLYALGCTFYFLLTGHVPFPGGTALQKLMKHQHDEPLAVETLRPEVPPGVARVVRQLMAKGPADRYQTPAELAAALTALSQALTGVTAAPVAGEQTSPVAGPAPSDDSLRSALAYMARRSDTVAFEPALRGPKSPKRRRWPIVLLAAVASAGLALVLLLAPRGAQKAADNEGDFKPVKATGKIRPTPPPPRDTPPDTRDGFVSLFNGKDLTGWTTLPRGEDVWKVEDGAITCEGSNSSYLFTQRGDFTDFHLRLEARINAIGKSGVMFRSRLAIPVDGYMASICAMKNKYLTGSLKGLAPTAAPVPPPNEWFALEIIARKDHLTILVNGQKAADGFFRYKFTRGHVTLQHMTADTKVFFRKLEIKELQLDDPPSAKAPAPWQPLARGPYDAIDPAKLALDPALPWRPRELIAVVGEQRFDSWRRYVTKVHLNSDGKTLYASSQDGTITIRDADSGRLRQVFEHGVWRAYGSAAFAVSPDERWLVFQKEKDYLLVWDLKDNRGSRPCRAFRTISHLVPTASHCSPLRRQSCESSSLRRTGM